MSSAVRQAGTQEFCVNFFFSSGASNEIRINYSDAAIKTIREAFLKKSMLRMDSLDFFVANNLKKCTVIVTNEIKPASNDAKIKNVSIMFSNQCLPLEIEYAEESYEVPISQSMFDTAIDKVITIYGTQKTAMFHSEKVNYIQVLDKKI